MKLGQDNYRFPEYIEHLKMCQLKTPCLFADQAIIFLAMRKYIAFRYFKVSREIIRQLFILYLTFPLSIRKIERLVNLY